MHVRFPVEFGANVSKTTRTKSANALQQKCRTRFSNTFPSVFEYPFRFSVFESHARNTVSLYKRIVINKNRSQVDLSRWTCNRVRFITSRYSFVVVVTTSRCFVLFTFHLVRLPRVDVVSSSHRLVGDGR